VSRSACLALLCVFGASDVCAQNLSTPKAIGTSLARLTREGKVKIEQTLPGGELKPAPNQSGKLPPPITETTYIDIQAGYSKSEGSRVLASEGCEVRYKGYLCLADSCEGDRESEIFTFSGNVRVIGQDSTIVGESVTVNFKAKTFNANYGVAQIKPTLLNNKVNGDIFMKGQQAFGNRDSIETRDCEVTTCDRADVHFHFDAERGTIEPKKQITLRDVKINILGKTVIRLPVLWIPLGDRSFKYLPQVGQTPDEGFYVKNTYGFPMRGEDRGAVRADYMQKLGTGLGMNYYYRGGQSNGITRIYSVFGRANTVTLNNQHEQRFNWGSLTVDSDYQKNNYLTLPGSSVFSTRAQLRLKGGPNIGFDRRTQATNGFNSFNETLTVSDQRQWRSLSTDLNMTLNRSGGSVGASRETLDVRFNGRKDVKKGVASLEFQKTIPIGETTNFFPGSDRTPVLTFQSDSQKLLGSKAPKTIPFRTEMSVGEYLDPVSKKRITRNLFDLNFNRALRDQGPWQWSFNGNFRQNLYSDDTAQYRINYGSSITYQLAKRFTANLRYAYLRPFGFSPLVIDRTGNTNFFTFDTSWQANSKSSFGLQTGYDIERGERGDIPWQQIGIRSEYRLGQAFSLRGLVSYDTFQQAWSNIRLDTTWQTPDLQASLGARYDGIRHTWSNLNLYLDGLQYGRTRIGTVLNFNGYSGRLDSQQYNFVYDLHCAEAILTISDFGTGFRSGREFGLFIRLKSIPVDSNFGRGRLGQALGSGTGRDF
jgi:hypothetical protein